MSYITRKMPIGIPQPDFDYLRPLPDLPPEWSLENTLEVEGYYYIEYGIGSDDNLWGSPSAPRRTIPRPIGAGCYVAIRGEYLHHAAGIKWIEAYGTEGEFVPNISGPVFIDFGINEENKGLLTDGKNMLLYGSNIFLDGATGIGIRNSINVGSNSSGRSVKNVVVRNCVYDGGGADVVSSCLKVSAPNSDPDSHVRDVVIYDNYIHDFGPIHTLSDNDSNGIVLSGNIARTWILDNHLAYVTGASVQLAPNNSTPRCTNTYIGRNHIHDGLQAGIGIKYAINTVISQNKIHDIPDTPWSPSKAVGGQYSPDNTWIIFNEIYNVRFGVRYGGLTKPELVPDGGIRSFIIGNYFHDIDSSIIEPVQNYTADSAYRGYSAFQMTDYYNVVGENNLIHNVENGWCVAVNDSSRVINTSFRNNIHAKVRYKVVRFIDSTVAESSEFKNNIFPLTDFSFYTVEEKFKSDFNELVNAENNTWLDFLDGYESSEEVYNKARYLSIIENAGVNMKQEHLDVYFDSFGVEFNIGLFDKVIPQGTYRDIGPWERGESYAEVRPDAPTGIYINVNTSELIWTMVSINETAVDIYKNGAVYMSDLPISTSHLFIPDICNSEAEYYVVVRNDYGKSVSETVTSDIISIADVVYPFNLDGYPSFYLPRTNERKANGKIMDEPALYGDIKGIPLTYVSFYDAQGEVGSGFKYIDAIEGSSIEGVLDGVSVDEVIVCSNNYSGGLIEAKVVVNDSVAFVTNAGGFLSKIIKIEHSRDTNYYYQPISHDLKSSIGIAAVLKVI